MLERSEKREQRLRYLKTLYGIVEGSSRSSANHHEIAQQAGLATAWAIDALLYLHSQGLLEYTGLAVNITHLGVKKAEEELAQALQRTVTNNILHISGELKDPMFHFGNNTDISVIYLVREEEEKYLGLSTKPVPPLLIDQQSETYVLDDSVTIETGSKARQSKKRRIRAAQQSLKGALANSLFDNGVRFLLSKLRGLR